MNKKDCPKELKINGSLVPVVCVYEKDWQKKVAEYMKTKTEFVIIGNKDYLDKLYNNWKSGRKEDLIKNILAGVPGVGIPALVSATAIPLILGAIGIGTALTPFTFGISSISVLASIASIVGVAAAIVIIIIISKISKVEFIKIDSPIAGLYVKFKS